MIVRARQACCSARDSGSSSDLSAVHRICLEGVMVASYITFHASRSGLRRLEETQMEATLNNTAAPQPLLPAIARFAIAVAVGLALTVLWIGAETESHQAVDNSTMALTAPSVHYVTLPGVEIVGRRLAKPNAA
jgi:hypothetical protein